MSVKKVAVLGSTGSIGINTLKVIEAFTNKFEVVALSAYSNVRLLERQIKKFAPMHVAVSRPGIRYLKTRIDLKKTSLFDVENEILQIVSLKQIDIVVLAMRGSAALVPFLGAIRHGKTVAPANKEALVIAGHIITSLAKRHHASIIPIDSEQSAIFQCLNGAAGNKVKKIYLTASGGPLFSVPKNRFDKISIGEILRHPRWKMGKKITVDSATLMNKGLEVMEAKWLFGIDVKNIEVIIHPEAIVHSMVEFDDGSILAQLGITDMRLPIQYALTYPERLKTQLPSINLCKLGKLTFKKPDYDKFPALDLCFHVGKRGGTLPAVLNAANEEAVEAFLNKRLPFSRIYKTVERVVSRHRNKEMPGLSEIWQADRWAREEARRLILN